MVTIDDLEGKLKVTQVLDFFSLTKEDLLKPDFEEKLEQYYQDQLAAHEGHPNLKKVTGFKNSLITYSNKQKTKHAEQNQNMSDEPETPTNTETQSVAAQPQSIDTIVQKAEQTQQVVEKPKEEIKKPGFFRRAYNNHKKKILVAASLLLVGGGILLYQSNFNTIKISKAKSKAGVVLKYNSSDCENYKGTAKENIMAIYYGLKESKELKFKNDSSSGINLIHNYVIMLYQMGEFKEYNHTLKLLSKINKEHAQKLKDSLENELGDILKDINDKERPDTEVISSLDRPLLNLINHYETGVPLKEEYSSKYGLIYFLEDFSDLQKEMTYSLHNHDEVMDKYVEISGINLKRIPKYSQEHDSRKIYIAVKGFTYLVQHMAKHGELSEDFHEDFENELRHLTALLEISKAVYIRNMLSEQDHIDFYDTLKKFLRVDYSDTFNKVNSK